MIFMLCWISFVTAVLSEIHENKYSLSVSFSNVNFGDIFSFFFVVKVTPCPFSCMPAVGLIKDRGYMIGLIW